MINEVFNWCVEILVIYAHRWGMTYEALNVWIFCVIEPIVFFVMLAFLIKQYLKIRYLKKGIKAS
jgi:hypothetical protein